jgi:hypothetical protein
MLRRTKGVKFDEMVPSDIPKISGIDRVIHGPNSISPGPIEDPVFEDIICNNISSCINHNTLIKIIF